jgi:hypothetical protein
VIRLTRRKVQIGVAVERSRIVAIRVDEAEKESEPEGDEVARPREFELDLPGPLEPTPEGIADYLEGAFHSISEALDLPAGGTVADLVLLPPLSSLRILQLPPVADEDLCRVLSRDARRYFTSAWERPVVGVCRLEEKRDGPASVLAAAAPSGLTEALFKAAAAVGWRVGAVAPAQSAWAALASKAHLRAGGDQTLRTGSSLTVVVLGKETTEVLQIRDGKLAGGRRLPAEWPAARQARFVAEIVREEGSSPHADETTIGGESDEEKAPPLLAAVVMGAEPARGRLVEALLAHGLEVLTSDDHKAPEDPAHLAAAFAHRATAPRFIPPEVRATIRRRSCRVALALAGGGALLLLLAALVELWGLHREVSAAAAHRTSLAPQVREALGAGDSLIEDIEQLVTLSELERVASRLSLVLPQMTEHLPRTSYLESFTARGDTLLLTGVAERAAAVFEGLQESPEIEAVQAEGPIRREEAEEGVQRESFTLSARVGDRAP